MAERVVSVTFKGDAKSLIKAAEDAAASVLKMEVAVAKSAKSVTDSAKSHKKAGDAVKDGSSKAAASLETLNKVVDTAKEGHVELLKVVMTVASAFGPLGIAAGIAAGAIIDLAKGSFEAEKKQRELAASTRELNLAFREKIFLGIKDNQEAERRAGAIKAAKAPIEEEIRDTERRIAAMQGFGLSTTATEYELAKLNAQLVRANAIGAGYNQTLIDETEASAQLIEHHAELARIRAESAAAIAKPAAAKPSKRASGKRPQSAEFVAELGAARDARNLASTGRDTGDTREFASELQRAQTAKVAGQIIRQEEDLTIQKKQLAIAALERENDMAAATAQSRVDFFGIERTDHDAAMQRIEAEKTARLELLQLEMEAATASSERLTIAGEMEVVQHDAKIARFDEERQMHAERMAMASQAISVAANSASVIAGSVLSVRDARVSARNAALAQGKTEKEAARAAKIAAIEAKAAQLQALRDLAIKKAIEQTAMGFGSLANFNPVSAALHFVAAGIWGGIAGGFGSASQSAASRATSMQRSDSLRESGGGSSSGGSGGGGSGSGSGSGPSDSPIPGSPGPSSPKSGTSGGGGGGSVTTYRIGVIHTYGTPEREFLRRIDEGLSTDVSGSRRRRSA